MLHIHFDPLGGVAGDMFVAAMLDAFPSHRQGALQAAQRLSGVSCVLVPHNDGTLTGSRFKVKAAADHHAHADWRDLRRRIEASDLPAAVRGHAVGVFAVLADAEARVHGTTPDEVTFHEVGAADSVADIVAAAWVIAAIGPATWSVGALPLGSGQVETAHGPMPIPAPATALLLEGFAVVDDCISGERVTPTGAALLRYVGCAPRPGGALRQSGFGFGKRRLNGVSNCLRALVIDTAHAEAEAAPAHRNLGVVSFEVDDQSGEDLAAGLERIRATEGVHDVLQIAAFGKKGRIAIHVQVLTQPSALDAVVAACFRETTTIGLRTHMVEGRALPRRFAAVQVAGQEVQVKLVDRPGGLTSKAESDHLQSADSQAARTRLRRDAERLAEAV